jgi:ketosteroid isomerase-like protein
MDDGNERAAKRLHELNGQYVDAYLRGDVAWYERHLAADFVCIESDGSVLDRAQFLSRAAGGPDVEAYRLVEVRVRLYGDVALVQAAGRFERKGGGRGTSRYTDVYVRPRDGADWQVVSAQITRREGVPEETAPRDASNGG